VKRWLKRNAWHLIWLIAMCPAIVSAWRAVREMRRQESILRRVMGMESE
jgi:hypothetical protein